MNKTLILYCICVFSLYVSLFPEGLRQNMNYRANAKKVIEKITVDGEPSEIAWKDSEKHELKYDTSPGDNAPALARTEFSTVRDEENLYFAFYCYDPEPDKIRAHMSERDRIFNDDFIILILDAFKDNQRVYEFCVNPYGIQGDLLRMGNNEDETYDALWYSVGKKTEYGYFVEIALPFKALRFPGNEATEWGLQVGRIYPRESRFFYSWTPNDRNNPCMMCQAGILDGMDNIKIKTSYEVLPYFASFQKSSLLTEEYPEKGLGHQDVMGRYGVSMKVTPSSEMVIEGVVNPDFSQIESDAQQISVNSTFALFYPEKRPFFLEGTEIFSTYMNTYYSRMINNPLWATKVTGKKGKVSYAVLAAQDRNSAFIVPGEEGNDYVETDIKSINAIGRLRYDFGEESYIGAITTNRIFNDAHNNIGGADFSYLFWKNYYFKGQFLYSQTKEIDNLAILESDRHFGHSGKNASFNGESYSGTAARVGFSRYTKNLEVDVIYRDVSPAFQGQSGFITSTDSRTLNIESAQIFYPDSTSILNRVNTYFSTGMTWNHEHDQKEKYLFLSTNLQFKRQVFFFIGGMPLNEEKFNGKKFTDVLRINSNIFARPWDEFSIGVWAEIGKFIYRDDIPALGKGHYAGCDMTVRFTDKLQTALSYNRARLSNVHTDQLYYDLYILRNVTGFQFTHELNIRIISEYSSNDKYINVFPLVSYKINPFTIFYLGATSNFEKYNGHQGYIQNDRQFFAKLQYLWNS